MRTAAAPPAPPGLAVAVLADEEAAQEITGALVFVARRVMAEAEPEALLRQLWRQLPDVIVVGEGRRADGIAAICGRLRQLLPTPILVAAGEAAEAERISWLDSGADDVLALRQSAPAELGARCVALWRRVQRQRWRNPAALRLEAQGLQLDLAARRLYLGGGPAVDVSAEQLCLLALLFSRDGAVVAGEALALHLSGSASAAARRRVEALIGSLNQRCASLPSPPPVERIRGLGYRLALVRPASAGQGGAATRR